MKIKTILLASYFLSFHQVPKDLNQPRSISQIRNKLVAAGFTKFEPRTTSISIKNFSERKAFVIGNKYVLVGHYTSGIGKISPPDYVKDFGYRLLFLDTNKKIEYKSQGAAEAFQFTPNFYHNTDGSRIIIICQLAYEYFYGGEAFLIENEKIKYLGNLDIESQDRNKKLTDILNINSKDNKIIFSFKADSLLLKPGNEDIAIKNNDTRYEYNGQSLRLINKIN